MSIEKSRSVRAHRRKRSSLNYHKTKSKSNTPAVQTAALPRPSSLPSSSSQNSEDKADKSNVDKLSLRSTSFIHQLRKSSRFIDVLSIPPVAKKSSLQEHAKPISLDKPTYIASDPPSCVDFLSASLSESAKSVESNFAPIASVWIQPNHVYCDSLWSLILCNNGGPPQTSKFSLSQELLVFAAPSRPPPPPPIDLSSIVGRDQPPTALSEQLFSARQRPHPSTVQPVQGEESAVASRDPYTCVNQRTSDLLISPRTEPPPNAVTPSTDAFSRRDFGSSRDNSPPSPHNTHTAAELQHPRLRRTRQRVPGNTYDRPELVAIEEVESNDSDPSDYSNDRRDLEDSQAENEHTVAHQRSTVFAESYNVGNPPFSDWETASESSFASEPRVPSASPFSLPTLYPCPQDTDQPPLVITDLGYPCQENPFINPPEARRIVWEQALRTLLTPRDPESEANQEFQVENLKVIYDPDSPRRPPDSSDNIQASNQTQVETERTDEHQEQSLRDNERRPLPENEQEVHESPSPAPVDYRGIDHPSREQTKSPTDFSHNLPTVRVRGEPPRYPTPRSRNPFRDSGSSLNIDSHAASHQVELPQQRLQFPTFREVCSEKADGEDQKPSLSKQRPLQVNCGPPPKPLRQRKLLSPNPGNFASKVGIVGDLFPRFDSPSTNSLSPVNLPQSSFGGEGSSRTPTSKLRRVFAEASRTTFARGHQPTGADSPLIVEETRPSHRSEQDSAGHRTTRRGRSPKKTFNKGFRSLRASPAKDRPNKYPLYTEEPDKLIPGPEYSIANNFKVTREAPGSPANFGSSENQEEEASQAPSPLLKGPLYDIVRRVVGSVFPSRNTEGDPQSPQVDRPDITKLGSPLADVRQQTVELGTGGVEEQLLTQRSTEIQLERHNYLDNHHYPPPIPRKSSTRLAGIEQENLVRQSESVKHLGTKFSNTRNPTYPSELHEGHLPKPLRGVRDQRPLVLTPSSNLQNLPRQRLSASDSPATSGPSDSVFSSAKTPEYTPSSASGPGDFIFSPSSNGKSPVRRQQRRRQSPFMMESRLQVRPDFTSVKARAFEDARLMQNLVIETANKSGQEPPKYALMELIGKGSFGRVYKAKDMTTANIVAVKIIDIDESDTVNPKNADSYVEFLKEVNALKLLSENKARNINHVVEALPVGQAMWMITEYCGGGSIATLMKPTSPGGLQEKWIIPILREAAEGLKWVHNAGIIHRDIKCANILITEDGRVQLCDFGVSGIVESKIDKRSTVIGTPHWMAPELFGPAPSYGKEVDIWAFGSMIYEMATGLPPNVATGVTYEQLGSHLKTNVPRLEGGNYSNELRSFVAFCLEELPSARPTIEQVQKHPYIYGTNSKYPTSSLAHLVRAFKIWEDQGGSRQSLFMHGGAQGLSAAASGPASAVYDDEWNFSTTDAFDEEVSKDANPQDVFEAYGSDVLHFSEETARPSKPQKPSRRRPPPEALMRLPTAPLQKVFDPNTLSNYQENVDSHYGPPTQPPVSDLPLRDDTEHTSIRDTMIDLGGHDTETGMSNFPDMDTIRAERRPIRDENDNQYGNSFQDFSKAPSSDPADINPNRRTQDWKFPSMAPPASADFETSRFPISYEPQQPLITPASGGRPALAHHPTEPVGGFGGMLGGLSNATERMSLIDLDMSIPDPYPEDTRPSTANSDVDSAVSAASEYAPGNPFELERHASVYQPGITTRNGQSPYRTEDSRGRGGYVQDISELSDFSASDAPSSSRNGRSGFGRFDGADDSDYQPSQPSQPRTHTSTDSDSQPEQEPGASTLIMARFPELAQPPSVAALLGTASQQEMKRELTRQLTGMTSQLVAFKEVYESEEFLVSQSIRKTGGNGNAR